MTERLNDTRLRQIRERLAAVDEGIYVQRDGDVWITEAAQMLLDEDAPALLDEVEALRADAKRLDWLVSHGYVAGLRRYSDGSWSLEIDTDDIEMDEFDPVSVMGASWREAVDTAMEEASDA